MTDVPTYKAPDGVNGPTLGGYLPEGCDRLGATCVPQNESTWVPWSDNSRERIISESLYWWRLPAFKKGDRVQIFVPPWPGAVLSGLVDEDGVPTWLALAPNVLGEAVRTCIDFPWFICGSDNAVTPYWVEVRAPRAVPEPETERVPWWDAVGDERLIDWMGDPDKASPAKSVGPWNDCPLTLWSGDKCSGMLAPVAPDGTVEVLRDGGR